ncbi:TrlF family AAA-like ATPase [Promicromonospora sp. MEB111]|uniref:TrlF family AAA-like ATPase n=1 Tax=Promicromonospora sp. MEB111 TaxID=3040301 RepID=UPI003305EB56
MSDSASAEVRRGTAWRIWDLHVHTPASIVNGYGGEAGDAWEKFIDELEALPRDIRVIGINDYWFLDGYKRVIAARQEGRLKNLDEVFPVVEMRLDQFGGTAGNLSRVNLHVIFDPEISAEVIEAQFVSALTSKIKLSPEAESLEWEGVVTHGALADLGRKIKASVPDDRKDQYGPDLMEGFNNLNVSLSSVQKILESTYFRGRTLIGMGKTEWAAIKWNEQSIAAKKTVINSANLIFTAFEDVSTWSGQVEKLRESNITHRLIDCSDAHYFSDSDQKMRLGACQTWMNATPTFAGLAHALAEFDRRVYVGLEPPALARVRRNPERFISSVEVRSDREDRKLFDYSIPINSGFIAVVGNKGQGKSALLDCIALAGNSSRNNEFAFLNPSRFLGPAGRKSARDYQSEIRWETGKIRRVNLHEGHDRAAPVSVEYLPQAFVERVCNTDAVVGEADEFERELRTVLFTHIAEEERAGEKTFDALLNQKTRAAQGDVDRLRDDLRELVSNYADAAAFRAGNRIDEIDGRIELKKEEVADAQRSLDEDRAALGEIDSAGRDDARLAALKLRSTEIALAHAKLVEKRSENERNQARKQQELSDMDLILQDADAIRATVVDLNARAKSLIGDSRPFITFEIDHERKDAWRDAALRERDALKAEHGSLLSQVTAQDLEREKNADELALADSARERARQRVLQSEERLHSLIGDLGDEESLSGLEELRERITQAPHEMERHRTRIVEHARQIHSALVARLRAVEGLYEPASRFIEHSDVVKNAGLEFNAELRVLPSWQSMSVALDGRRNTDFLDWLNDLPRRIEDTSWSQLAPQLEELLSRLEHERGELDGSFRDPASALRKATSLQDFLIDTLGLSWLEVRFGLIGEGLPLSQLSPGQRGLILALFYLVVDRRTTPLLLDQPEENLDNATIASKLVPAIHEAAGRRQTIVVTHNANLAVVGDADQIIHCKVVDQRFTLESGSISEIDVARFALDVLEGTKPAFDNRRHKYEAFPELG